MPGVGQRRSFLLPLSLAAVASAACFVSSPAFAQNAATESPPPATGAPSAAPESSPATNAQPPSAAEAGAGEPSSADRATARTLAQEGYNALKGRDYATAADRFTRALALVHAPTLLRDLARSQIGLGKLVDAHENYSLIIREGVAEGAPQSWVKALADAKVEIAQLAPRLPSITITVEGPGTPRVTIDGAPIAAASLGVKRAIDPGRHEIRALGTGYYTAKKTVSINEGESINVAFDLEEAPPDASATTLEEERNSGVVVTFAEPAWRKPTMIAAFAVGGAGLALGAVTGVLALRKHGQLSTDCARNICGPKQRAELDNYHTLGQLSTIGFVVAGVGAAAGTVLLFMRPQPQEDEADSARSSSARNNRVQVSPFLGLGSAGLEGTF
jgi:hypothetical protein